MWPKCVGRWRITISFGAPISAIVVFSNATGSTFGLTTKEIALTLDDGPGPRTIEIAGVERAAVETGDSSETPAVEAAEGEQK